MAQQWQFDTPTGQRVKVARNTGRMASWIDIPTGEIGEAVFIYSARLIDENGHVSRCTVTQEVLEGLRRDYPDSSAPAQEADE